MLLIPALFLSAAQDPRDLTAAFEIEAGLEVRLWADTPQLYNPTAIDVDARGRIWVAEAVNYRQWQGRNPGLHHDAGDRIVILEDTDGDGVCDSSKVFVQEQELVAPLGICVAGKQVIVSCSPDLIVYTDTDGDDKPDKREVLLTGFGGRDHDHGLHSFVQGPEGEWYGTVGNAGPHLVSDQRGWTLRSGSIYRGGGAEETDNHPRLESDDGRVYTGGLVLRVSPQGERLRVLAHNFRNNYEVALDSFGNLFQSDNDDDGNQACRTLWVMEGGNYGYFSADGSREWGADRRPGQSTTVAHWHQEDPGVMPTSCIDGAGGPTGMCVYEGGLLPKADVGLVLGCDAGRNCVYAHRPVRQGSGYALEHGVFLKAREDPKDEHWRWFRPSDVCVGAEGALYVADWYDPGVGGHAAGDKEARGRILRIAPRGDRTRAPKIALDTPEHAAEALRSPAVSVRGQAVVALQKFGTRGAGALDPLLASPEPRLVARALLALSGMGDGGIAKMLARRDDPNPELRLTVVHGWRHAYERLRVEEARTPPLLFAENEDPKEQDQAVLRELALCTRWNSDRTGRWRAFNGLDPRKLPPRWDGQDPWLLETLCDAYGGLPDLFYEQAGTLEQDPLRWAPRTAKLAWRLHFPACVPALLARAMASSLSPAERKQAVESLAFVREREGAEAMLTLALGGPADVRELARWWVEQRATNDWAAYGLQAQLQHGAAAPARDTARERTLLATLARAGATAAECDAAASELCTTREGGLALLGLAAGGKLGEPGKQAAARAIGSCPDPSVRALAAQYFPPAAAKRPSSFEVLHLAGDAHAGAKTFFGDKTRCSSCHSFYGRGGDIGPDLSALSTKYGRKELLEAILDPNAAIANGYDTWLFETTDGELIPGFLVSEGDPLVLRDTSGQKHVLAASELVSRTRQKVSAMPADVAAGLSPQELCDLVEFLATNPRLPGRRLAEKPLFDGASLSGWSFYCDDPKVRLQDVFTLGADGVLDCKGTPIGYLRTEQEYTNFALSLEWRHVPGQPPGNSGVLMRRHGPDKIWPASIEAQLQHRNAGDIWNIDAFPMQVDALRTEGRRTAKLAPTNEKPVGEWNLYEIVLDGGELRLVVNGVLQNSASWCEEIPGQICLQSEGARIQFRNVKITPIER